MTKQWALVLVLVAGCATEDSDTDTHDDTAELSSCLRVPLSTAKSLAITDPVVLSRFSFERTVTQILTSANVISTETPTQLFQQWMSTYGSSDCTNPLIDPQHYGERCPRQPEAALATLDPFGQFANVHFKPVGLFNRFDLAPSDGSNCGEYRIIYALDTGPHLLVQGRGFLIFEAALPNPDPSRGIDACRPIAKFWADRSGDTTPAQTAAALEQFYFTGGVAPGFGPVVDAHNYGLGTNAGQIRADMFISNVDWNLREFKTERRCAGISGSDGTSIRETCRLLIDHVSVKNNPANELFQGTHPLSGKFVEDFALSVRALATNDVSTIGMNTGDLFNEFESRSQALDVVYEQLTPATSPLRPAIQRELDAIGSTLDPQDILARATTQTCAGCHQVSNFDPLGGGLAWPKSLGFTQIDEQGNLSVALTGHFLPHRSSVLQHFLCDPHTDGDSGLTVGGSQVGAAN
ncbi:MAG TPA: hypothetical protein VGM39_16455 [Kofleriaceae bacterium]|jgi:hypothetical protein